jgi:hydroxymethylbilane synthase
VSPKQTIRIATRSSELALRQARMVAQRLAGLGVESELVTYKTAGDKNLDVPLSKIGAKGLFTQELEHDLLKGKVQCCVHSLKDLPTAHPDGLEIGAVLEREDPRDVLVVNHLVGSDTLEDLPRGSRVGTSSLRRRAQLLALRKDLEVVELRGNVPTRVRKVDDGQVHAAILAAAGLHRLEARQRINSYLDAPRWLPAPAQGAIAVQIRSDDEAVRHEVAKINDKRTEVQTRAERSFLASLEGGCQVPIGALASDTELHGLIADLGGREVIRASVALDDANPETSGRALADQLRARGANRILDTLRAADNLPSPQPE